MHKHWTFLLFLSVSLLSPIPFFRVSAGSSPSLSSSPRALSRVVPILLYTSQRILSLTLCIFSSSRFTAFFSTDLSVPQGLQPSSPTYTDDSPRCVCMCVNVCLCVALPLLLATWTQCQAACIREAHTQVHPDVPNAHSGLAASKTIIHRCPSLGAPYLTSGWSPGQVHPDCESAPGHTMGQKDTLVILARPAESMETPGPSWSHLQRGRSLSPGLQVRGCRPRRDRRVMGREDATDSGRR